MRVKMILAVDSEGGIGKDGKLPWHIPSEFKYFAEYTSGCMCIMGRKTYEDVKGFSKQSSGSLLPNRSSLVFSTEIRSLKRANTYDSIVFSDNPFIVMETLTLAKKKEESDNPDVCIIGGKSIYELFLNAGDLVDEISITFLPESYDCDTFMNVKELTKGFLPIRETVEEGSNGWKAIIYTREQK